MLEYNGYQGMKRACEKSGNGYAARRAVKRAQLARAKEPMDEPDVRTDHY